MIGYKYLSTLVIFTFTMFVSFSNSVAQSKRSNENQMMMNLIRKVEANPENEQAHHEFIKYCNERGYGELLVKQYDIWTTRFSKSLTVPLLIGQYLQKKKDSHATAFLLKALTIKPDMADVLKILADNAQFQGNDELSQGYLLKAVNADRKNPDYLFYYATTFEKSNSAKYDSLLLRVAWRFPHTERGAQALNLLALNSVNQNEKVLFYESLYKNYSNSASETFAFGMEQYFEFLIKTDLLKALNLAINMNLEPNIPHKWENRLHVVRSLIKINDYLSNNKQKEAAQTLRQIDLGQGADHIHIDETLFLYNIDVMGTDHNSQSAFDSIANHYIKWPTEQLSRSLFKYANKLSMDSSQVYQRLYALQESKAATATDFQLKDGPTDRIISLTDYKGKVILLTYWFPSCGPCREELSHIESVLKKFNRADVVYLGLNIVPSENSYVLPFLKATEYSFIPLQDELNRNKGNLTSPGAPTNYLLNQNGKIFYSNFIITGQNERTLELMIAGMLRANHQPAEHN